MKGQADPKFRAEIGALIEARHKAFLAGEPGDGLAVNGIAWIGYMQDAVVERVVPEDRHFTGTAKYQGSECEGHTCPR